jgi:prepilin-type processing-associated H-X9-DG protein
MVIMPREASWTAAALCRFLRRTQGGRSEIFWPRTEDAAPTGLVNFWFGFLFIFGDVREDGILNAVFGALLPGSSWEEIWFERPANRHSRGCCFSFADGHAERWK